MIHTLDFARMCNEQYLAEAMTELSTAKWCVQYPGDVLYSILRPEFNRVKFVRRAIFRIGGFAYFEDDGDAVMWDLICPRNNSMKNRENCRCPCGEVFWPEDLPSHQTQCQT